MSNMAKLAEARRALKIGRKLKAAEHAAVMTLLDEVFELSKGTCPCCGKRATSVCLDMHGLTWCCFEGCNP